jgi:hypothetical protein
MFLKQLISEDGLDYINEVLRLDEDSKLVNAADSAYLVQAAEDIMVL